MGDFYVALVRRTAGHAGEDKELSPEGQNESGGEQEPLDDGKPAHRGVITRPRALQEKELRRRLRGFPVRSRFRADSGSRLFRRS